MFLVVDIGGTKISLALFNENSLKKERSEIFYTKHFESFEAVVAAFLKEEKISAAAFGVAGPVITSCKGKLRNQKVGLTNLGWEIDKNRLQKRYKFPVFLLNDLLAGAYGIPLLKKSEFLNFNIGKKENENEVLIIPGTGLGIAGIFFDGNNRYPFASEGGHSDFSAKDSRECELLFYLKENYGHASWERILSGPGIVNLYHFLTNKQLTSEKIISYGISNKDKLCREACIWFISLLGSFCGDIALEFLTTKHLYLSGNIANALFPKISPKHFMKTFLEKGRFSKLLSKIPVALITNKDLALLGALNVLKNKQIDF